MSTSSATAFGILAASITGTKLSRRTRVTLERGNNPHSGQPVWRNSYTEGTIESKVWRPINDGGPAATRCECCRCSSSLRCGAMTNARPAWRLQRRWPTLSGRI